MVFTMDNDEYLMTQERYKVIVNDAADAAALYYDKESFADGIKVFNKASGNAAALDVIKSGLNLNDDLRGGISFLLQNPHDYYLYYFDGNGTYSKYKNGSLIETSSISYPCVFREDLTGYEKMVEEPTVIATIDAGYFHFREIFITDPRLIRTSGYEHVSPR